MCVCVSQHHKISYWNCCDHLRALTAKSSVPSAKVVFLINHFSNNQERSRLPLTFAALHMFKSSDELLNTCGHCCSWHGWSGKLAPRPGERGGGGFYWGQLLCSSALPAPAGWQARCTPPARRFPAEPPSLGASHAHLSSNQTHRSQFAENLTMTQSRLPKFKLLKNRGKERPRWLSDEPINLCLWFEAEASFWTSNLILSASVSSLLLNRKKRECASTTSATKKIKNGPSECFNRVYHSGALTQQNYSWLLPTLDNSALT